MPRLRQEETFHRTRHEGISYLTSLLLEHVEKRRRVLVGFDFPYGYPSGFSQALGLSFGLHPWRRVWDFLADKIQDNAKNVNNRFIAAGELNAIVGGNTAGPFWGCPLGTRIANLQRRSPGFPFNSTGGVWLQRLRIVEKRLSGTQEAWKLYGAGSAGSQALVGIPYVYRVRRHPELAWFSRVWPFETGFTADPSPDRGPFVLHSEIWPGVVKVRTKNLLNADKTLIQDQAQVRAMCQWAKEIDDNGQLGRRFDKPTGLTTEQIQACVQHEGWVLGAG